MADSLLDRKTHPDWNGERTKMVYSFPTNEKLWDEYRLLRSESLASGDGGRIATEFYGRNREAMDAGSDVAWPERHNHDELSAIQHAMNLKFRDENAFYAEYQNEPTEQRRSDIVLLAADQICARVNQIPRGTIPRPATRVTAMIDVQQSLLYWLVAAWEDDFTGAVVDYGCWPDQGRVYWTLSGATKTIQTQFAGQSLDEQIYQSTQGVFDMLLRREWPRDGGGQMKIDRLLIDANWGQQTDTVYRAARQSPHSALITPSHGKFIGATSKPMAEYQKRDGERAGLNWRTGQAEKRSIRHVHFDANYWKSFVHNRLAVAMGGRSSLSLFGNRPQIHQMFADHVLSEDCIPVEAMGRVVNQWKMKPFTHDNHFFDCIVGAAVAASMSGSNIGNPSLEPVKKRLSFSEMQARKQEART
jgi:phage terminase large subunit GpA-like protein